MLNKLLEHIKTKYDLDIINDSSRKSKVIMAKAAVINIMYWYLNNSLTNIATQLGYLNHTSVLHHVKDHKNRYTHEVGYADIYDELKEITFKERPDVVGDVSYMLDIIEKIETSICA